MLIFRNSKGFTLTELIVAVAIITSLAAIGLPSYTRYKHKAMRSEAYAYITQIINAEKAVYGQNGSYINWAAAPARGVKEVGGENIFHACPAANDCGKYNVMLSVGGADNMAERRSDGNAVDALWPEAQGPLSDNFDTFVVVAKGDIIPDGDNYGDVIYYNSDNAAPVLECDDMNPVGPIPVGCSY